ncbi:tryptophan synthase subunit alpha [Streptomyces sp. BB1-1-1]|uniref:tryptophan synthase subunit alpha n=1 Tax=Streptomyces sp. BB1-1-1 TaxID=3074430 RepID=UPI0028775FAE|nr:tryptophan synthase subunit alpha [Streptomyces sp. BB1-1-1]WND40242.1 tryptophan synthase subunit alpha [Streptomyces sp. BB1-1-1]
MATANRLHTLLTQPRCALGVFLPAGVHQTDVQCRQLDHLAQSGADLFEIGLPCANPALDGLLIRSAYHRALLKGDVIDRTVRAVAHAASLRPTVVMTYWEPVRRHGPEHLARLLADAGAAGVMVVDLPRDETLRWHHAAHTAHTAGLSAPRLVPRATQDTDLPAAVDGASGWLYAPASTGPTGYQGPLDLTALDTFIQRLRTASPLPVVSGVGISSPGLAASVAPLVDAVVIGTPIVRALLSDPAPAGSVTAAFAQALRTRIGTAPDA